MSRTIIDIIIENNPKLKEAKEKGVKFKNTFEMLAYLNKKEHSENK